MALCNAKYKLCKEYQYLYMSDKSLMYLLQVTSASADWLSVISGSFGLKLTGLDGCECRFLVQ